MMPNSTSSPRVLVIGPIFHTEMVGGLQLALADIVAELRKRGWHVDDQLWTTSCVGQSKTPWQSTFSNSRLAPLQRWPFLLDLWVRAVPPTTRNFISALWMPRPHIEALVQNLLVADRLLADPTQYDLVLVCADGTPPGLCSLVASRHPRVVFLSLPGLAQELRAGWWGVARWVVRLRFRQPLDPFLYCRIVPEQVRLAIFASNHWRRETVQAGLAPDRAHAIYFGIPQPPSRPRSSAERHRILWVGRLTWDKGLHFLLRALPQIRRELGEVSVTAIAGQGPPAYRRQIDALIAKHGLEHCVTLAAPVNRAALQEAYATHDLLFFYSQFSDPVAFVLMEAFAANLPVVASAPGPEAYFVEPGITCLCYRPGSQNSLASAVITLLRSAELRQELTTNALQRVREAGSLDQMGAKFDELLRRYIAPR